MVSELIWVNIYRLDDGDDLIYYEDLLLELNIPVKLLDCNEALLPKRFMDCGKGPYVYVPKKYQDIATEVLEYDKQGILGQPFGFDQDGRHMDWNHGEWGESVHLEETKSNSKYLWMVLATVFILLILLRILMSSNIL